MMLMKIIDINKTLAKTIIKQTIEVLSSGGLVIFPTETTYGAGVDATNQEAVDKLLGFKTRREGKPLSIVVKDKEMASKYVEVNEQANKIYNQFLPGPVTVVSKSLGNTANGVASEFGTLGIRIPDYQIIIDIVKQYKKPITATSANASGKKRPYKIEDIFNNISNKQKKLIDLVLDAGQLPKRDPSTIIDTTLSAPVTLRSSDNIKINNLDSTVLISSSEQETKEIAARLVLKNWNKVGENGLIIALDGSLGTGKTIFTKGVAEFLKITETIQSPTYSYIEEYDYQRHQTKGRMYHLDMWKVENKDMYKRLEVDSLIGKNNIVVIEWFDQIKEYLKSKYSDTHIIKIKLTQENNKRNLEIYE